MVFLQGILARMGLMALWKVAVHYWYRLRYLLANKVDKSVNKQDSDCLKNAKTEKDLEKCSADRAGHI